MFNKEKIIEILNNEGLFIDNFILDAFIKNWKIEPIYEDPDGLEFFDEMALEKIRDVVKQKQTQNDEDVCDDNSFDLVIEKVRNVIKQKKTEADSETKADKTFIEVIELDSQNTVDIANDEKSENFFDNDNTKKESDFECSKPIDFDEPKAENEKDIVDNILDEVDLTAQSTTSQDENKQEVQPFGGEESDECSKKLNEENIEAQECSENVENVAEVVVENLPELKELESAKNFKVSALAGSNNETSNGLKNVTLDISNQTLAVLAESIARKITYDVSDHLKKIDFIEDAMQLGEFKKDNQVLAEKVEELLADNKALVKKIEELEKERNSDNKALVNIIEKLEKERNSFVKLFGNVYIKNQ